MLVELDPVKPLQHLEDLVGIDTRAFVLDVQIRVLPSKRRPVLSVSLEYSAEQLERLTFR